MTDQLCRKCILPEDYAGISFDEDGVCNHCRNAKERKYLGKEKLREDIDKILKEHPGRKYDCVVGFSGGRDSSYMLYYLVKELNLKPLAVFIDSGLIPEQTIDNIYRIVKILGVELKHIRTDYLTKAFPRHFNAWLKNPGPETLITFCVGCRLGIMRYVDREAVRQKVPMSLSGESPYEGKLYKSNIVKINPASSSGISFLTGYLKQVIKNPSLVLNPYCLYLQTAEYLAGRKRQKALFERNGIKVIHFFYHYIHWDEKIITDTLANELQWKTYPGIDSQYRSDCEIGIIRQLLYWKLLGYNDKDDHLSCLIRDGQITRKEALDRLDSEHHVPGEIVRHICKKAGIDYAKLKEVMENYQKR